MSFLTPSWWPAGRRLPAVLPLLTLWLGLGLAPHASAVLLVDEPFSYPDGPLEAVAPGVWSYYSGTPNQVLVSSGWALLSHTNLAEEVNTSLPGAPHTNGNLYASFTVRCTALPANGGTFFAQFKDPGSAFRARVFVTTNGAPASRWRVGIANAASATTNYFPASLVLSSQHRLVVRYNASSGSANLWLDPISESDPSLLAADTASPAAVAAFVLRQTPWMTNSVGTLQIDDLKMATSFPEVTAVWDNRWTALGDAKWEVPTQWSLGTPSGSQAGPLIANTPSKTVIIDATTAEYYPASLIVSNITVSAPDALTTNTLLLDKVGANYALVVSNVFTLGRGSALTLFDSALYLPGRTSAPWGSPGFYVDGPVILTTNASVSASNVSILAGNFSGSTNGAITLDDASLLAGKLVLGNADGAFGSLTMNSGLLTFPAGTNLLIGGAPNADGDLTVNGGLLDAPASLVYIGAPGSGALTANGGEIRPGALLVGQSGVGKLVVQGGSVEPADHVAIGLGDTGTVLVTGGQLVVTNAGGEIRVGGNSEGTLTVGSNGVVVAKSLDIATNDLPGYSARGTLEVQPGGLLIAEAHLAVGVSPGSTGLVAVTGGTISAPEIIVGLSNSRGTLQLTNGTVSASNLLVGLSATGTGVVNVVGGTLTATSGVVRIGVAGSGLLNISDGHAIATDVRLGGSTSGADGVLRLTGGRLTVLSLLSVNAFDAGGGDLDGSGGEVIIAEGHNASMTISAGTATNIGILHIGYSGGYTGTFNQEGGLVTVLTNVLVGDCASGAVGNVTLDGGTFYANNSGQTAEFNIRNGSVVLSSGGMLIVDRLVITNACARFVNNGGFFYATATVLDPNMDADGDGLPNAWEQTYSLDPLATAANDGALGDPDADGQSNLAEYRAGTDPQSAASAFRLLSAAVIDQDVRLDWMVVGGRSYVVQIATNGTGGLPNTFSDLSGLISVGGTGEGTTNYVHEDGATNRGAYYRVRLGP